MSAPAASPAVGATPPPTVNSTAPPPATPAAPPPAQPPPSAPPPAPPASPPPAAPAPTSPSPPSGGGGGGGAIPTPPTPPAPPLPPATTNPPPPPANNPSPPSGVPATPSPPSPASSTPAGRSPPAAPRTPSGGNNPPTSSGGGGGGGGLPSTAIIGIAVGGVLVALILGLVVCCLRRRKPKKKYGRDDYGSGQYKADLYEAGRRPPYGGPPPPPPPPPHAKHYAYGSPGPAPPPPPPPPPLHYSSSGSQGSWKPVPPPPPPHGLTPSMGNSRSWFTYDELEEATGGFARANMLGEGGFGCVYKGQLRGGQIVAVKQLKAGSGQGEREFRAEVEIISRVHHRHLVSLVGYCIADSQRLLVYDYVPNGTLEHHLHGRGRPVMDWPSRLRIAAGAARGLAYLHEDCHPRIIHRDIKSSNILLDNNFEAQVSDFGLAKLASDTYTHITTRVMGTFGYLAPEYASTGKLTDKSDVYSFGVVLLEMISGRKPVDTTQVGDESLVEWARPLLTQALDDGNIRPLVDPRLVEYNEREMLRMIEAAAACVRHSASKRPRMAQVVRVLENDEGISDLNQGVKPGHSSNYGSADYGNSQYSADMRRFKKMAFGSHEYGSEYSAPTSEYGMNPSVSSSEALSSMEMEKRKNGTDTSSSEMHTNIASEGLNGR